MARGSRWWQAVAVGLLVAGCSGQSSVSSTSHSLLEGNLYQKTTANGQVLCITARNLEGWDRYDRNPRKGNGDSCVFKAEVKF